MARPFRNWSSRNVGLCALPSRPREFHHEPLTDSGLDTLASSGSCHRAKAAAFHWTSGSSRCRLTRAKWRWPAPFAPRALHPLPRYYEAVRPCPAHRYFRPRGWSRLHLFPWHRRPGSHVPYKSLVELRAAYMPDAAWAVSVHPPSLSRKTDQPPVLASSNPLSTLHRRFTYVRLSQSCRNLVPAFPATFT